MLYLRKIMIDVRFSAFAGVTYLSNRTNPSQSSCQFARARQDATACWSFALASVGPSLVLYPGVILARVRCLMTP